MKRVLAVSVVMLGLAAGSIGVATVNPLGIAGAADTSKAQVAPPPAASSPAAGVAGPMRAKAILDSVLSDLVAKGTITQAQADAIRAGVAAKVGKNPGQAGRERVTLKPERHEIARLLGMDPAALMAQLKAGKSLAEIAKARGIDPQTLIDSLVKSATARIDAAVASGRLDKARADAMKKALPARMKALVARTAWLNALR